jgi:lipopolysaccharide export system permease protein
MATLQVYIGRRFFGAIIASLSGLALLVFLVDFVELLRRAGKYGEVPASKIATIALLHLPSYLEPVIGFAVLIGSIGALLSLNRRSELTVARAAGLSVWQFLLPGIIVASVLGLIELTIYNPLAARAMTKAAQVYTEAFGREITPSELANGWLREDGLDGQSVLNARATINRGLTLLDVTIFTFDGNGRFAERIDASRADLQDGAWLLTDGWVAKFGYEPHKFGSYLLATYLTPQRASAALGDARTVSSWDLPALIDDAEKAKVPATQLKLQFEQLLSRPLLCASMVLLAATVSLRSFRSGNIITLLVTGMIGGFGFFLFAELSRQVGVAKLTPIWESVWLPIIFVVFISVTVLLYQEDG